MSSSIPRNVMQVVVEVRFLDFVWIPKCAHRASAPCRMSRQACELGGPANKK